MKISFTGIGRQLQREALFLREALEQQLLLDRQLSGPQRSALENEMAKTLGRAHAVAVGSGTDALIFSLHALGVGPGDEVIVPSFSFIASASAILHVGARPVFADIDENGFMMAPGEVSRLLTKKTKAILAVHIAGQMISADVFKEMRTTGLPILEDFAQGLGASSSYGQAGNLGVISCTSFDPTKILGNISTGGMALTDDPVLAERLRAIRFHGRDPDNGQTVSLGRNSQMNELSCAYLNYRLKGLAGLIGERKRVAQHYLKTLKGLPQVKLPSELEPGTHTWQKFIVRIPHRDQVQKKLNEAGIETRAQYARPLDAEPLFERSESSHCLTARRVCSQALALPIYPELAIHEVELISNLLASCLDPRSQTPER